MVCFFCLLLPLKDIKFKVKAWMKTLCVNCIDYYQGLFRIVPRAGNGPRAALWTLLD